MKAVILETLNAPLLVEEIQPETLKVGQVLVQVICATICGKQMDEIRGRFGPDKYLPHLLGHEGCGDVVECGPGVTTVAPDDRVVMHWRKGRGIDAEPPRYHFGNTLVGAGPVATFTELAVISENRLTKIGTWVPPRVASLMGCAVTTALGLIKNEAHLEIGQTIVVAGCGGVGLNIIQGALIAQADSIIAIDQHMEKLVSALNYGATRILHSNADNLVGRILAKIEEPKVDVFVDCTGSPEMVRIGLAVAKLVIAVAPTVYVQIPGLINSQGGMTQPNEDILRYLELYRKGTLDLDRLVTHVFPIDQVNEAVALLKTDSSVGRVALEML